MKPVLLVTDLDGSLLDDDYGFAAARDALDRIKVLGWTVALNTSKTLAECRYWRHELGVGDYLIPENGAAIIEAPADGSEQVIEVFGRKRQEILAFLTELRAQGFDFESFADLSVAELAYATQLQHEQARMASERNYSEPLTLGGDDTAKDKFLQALLDRGLSAQRGGRYTTVSGNHDKGTALRYLQNLLSEHHTFALGDSWNDIRMLDAADSAGVILNPSVPLLTVCGCQRIFRSKLVGAAGWAELVNKFIDEAVL